ncbi:MAG: PAS domain S-box protein [Chloroflexi bacterium]|nr:PAS domain S-box protein [Chloroflexota bacterium]
MRTIIAVHQVIAREDDVGSLIRSIAQTLVQSHGYYSAWLAILDDNHRLLDIGRSIGDCNIEESCGPAHCSLMAAQMRNGDLPVCAKIAMRQPMPLVIADPKQMCTGCIFDDHTCAMVTRLAHADKIYGLMTVATHPNLVVHPDEQALVQELAADIAYALHKIKQEEGRELTEKSLRDSELFRSSLLIHSPNPVLVINPDTSIKYANPALKKLTGLRLQDLIGRKAPYPWWPRMDKEKLFEELQVASRCRVGNKERMFYKKDGSGFWVDVKSAPIIINSTISYCLEMWTETTVQKKLMDNLRLYALEVTRAQEEERRRIARELHDETLQKLCSLIADVDEIAYDHNAMNTESLRLLKLLQDKIDDTIVELRDFSHELRPALLDEFGLEPTLRLLTEEVERSSGLDCQLEIIGSARRLGVEVELALFRTAQEALKNVIKHAGATEVHITIEFRKKSVELKIADDGKGFRLADSLSSFASQNKFGLIGMSERAHLLSSELMVTSRRGKGTTVSVACPCSVTHLPS